MASGTETASLSRTPHKYLILLAVGSAMFLGTVDGSIVNVALPTLARELRAPFHLVQWTVLSFLMGVASLMLTMGRLGDMIGKKRVFMTGLVVFVTASALCGLAPGIYWLIAFRFLQSVGAAMTMSLGVAIVSETWPPSERATALGIAAGMISLGAAAGPTMGGLILHLLNWRWIFFVNLPVGLVSLSLSSAFVPALRPARRPESFDFTGALLAGLTMLGFVLAMTFTQTRGLFSTPVLVSGAASFLGVIVFIRWERHVPHPMLDLSLFRSAAFRLNLFTGFTTFVSIAGIILMYPFYLEVVRGLSEQQVGIIMGVTPVMLAVCGPISGVCADRFGTRPVSLVGLVAILVGYLTLCRLTVSSTPVAFVLLQTPMALGMATFQSPNNASIMDAVPRQRLGVANGMLGMTRTMGQLTGVSLLGTFFFCRLQARAGHAVDVATAPPATVVQALHDQFYLAAALVALGAVAAFWQASREWREEKTGKANPGAIIGAEALTSPAANEL
jgi:EmrB/QacA subfamily drug resistance transporter